MDVMDRDAFPHSDHDEMLIVRLFGGDVSDRERVHALELLGECGDCAELFGDLGATADATAALPIPTRPRDFFLTEADAARLVRERRGVGLGWLVRRTRAFGGSLVAIGLVGLVATASLSALSGTATTMSSGTRDNAAPELAVASAGSMATAAPAAAGAVAQASEPISEPSSGAKTASSVAEPSAQVADAAGSAEPPGEAPPGMQLGPVDGGSPDGVGGSAAGASTAFDARLIWFGGFGLLFLVGLGVLIGPRVRRRSTR